ncbi:MAG: cell division protein FtsZ [Muribaculaceae bacterium]|nr:cell division protein FtsZ [Muribaculaceae bacterium]
MTIDDIKNDHDFVFASGEETIIKVIGVGGGGNNAINHMYAQGIKNVSFVVCNTDRQALDHSPVPNRVLIGPNITKGLGAGNKPEMAKLAAEESSEQIDALFNDNTKMVFITAGMGGGTGTGAAPVVARIAKERGLLTIGIVTIPFLFEGEKKILKALDGADEMSKYVDALLVINNERLTEIYRDLDFINAFGKADDTLSTAARSISELITCNGHINLDFNDVDTTLRNGGAAIISSGYGEGENRVTKAINDALNSPLLKNRDIFGSKKLLFNLYFSREAEHKFVMDEAQELTDFISNLDSGVDVIWGVAFDESLGDKIKITILAAGFDVTIRDDAKTKRAPRTLFPSKPEPPRELDRLIDEYGTEKINEIQNVKDRARYIILQPEQMDDDSVVEKLEKTPAFNRDKKVADEIKSGVKKVAVADEDAQFEQESNPSTDNRISINFGDE